MTYLLSKKNIFDWLNTLLEKNYEGFLGEESFSVDSTILINEKLTPLVTEWLERTNQVNPQIALRWASNYDPFSGKFSTYQIMNHPNARLLTLLTILDESNQVKLTKQEYKEQASIKEGIGSDCVLFSDLLKEEEEEPIPIPHLSSVEKVEQFIRKTYKVEQDAWLKEWEQLNKESTNPDGITSKYRHELSEEHLKKVKAYYEWRQKRLKEEKVLLEDIIKRKVKGQVLLAKRALKEVEDNINKAKRGFREYCIPV